MNKSKPTQDVIEMGKDYLDVVKAAKKKDKRSKSVVFVILGGGAVIIATVFANLSVKDESLKKENEPTSITGDVEAPQPFRGVSYLRSRLEGGIGSYSYLTISIRNDSGVRYDSLIAYCKATDDNGLTDTAFDSVNFFGPGEVRELTFTLKLSGNKITYNTTLRTEWGFPKTRTLE